MENSVCEISWNLVENWLRNPRNSIILVDEFNVNLTIVLVFIIICVIIRRVPFHHTWLYSSAFVHFILFSRHWHWQFTNTLKIGLHVRKFSTTSGAEELVFILSIENPAAIIIRTRDIRTDSQTPVTYACLIFGMLVYSYLCMMPFLSLEIFISHVNDFGQYKRHVNSWSAS